MYYIDLNNTTKYNDILSYILKTCDEVSFHFPILCEERYNTPYLLEDYKKYQKAKAKLLSELFNHQAKKRTSNIYQNIKLGYTTQIINVKLYPDLIEMIKNNHLYNWVWWNALPEDPCFFSNNECRFITISHEETFYVCDNTKDSSLIKLI